MQKKGYNYHQSLNHHSETLVRDRASGWWAVLGKSLWIWLTFLRIFEPGAHFVKLYYCSNGSYTLRDNHEIAPPTNWCSSEDSYSLMSCSYEDPSPCAWHYVWILPWVYHQLQRKLWQSLCSYFLILWKSSRESQYLLALIHFCCPLTSFACQLFWMVCLGFAFIGGIHSSTCCQRLIYYLGTNPTSLLLLHIISGFCSFMLVNDQLEKALFYFQKLSLFLSLVGFYLCFVYFLHKYRNVNLRL